MKPLNVIPPPVMKLGERCVLLRRRLGWVQKEMAGKMGIGTRTVVNIERGANISKRTRERFEILEKRYRQGKGKVE
jgi:transcriptional regulator with XRE-family HTH domain